MLGQPKRVAFAVMVAALGYFVDIYDLILFSMVRVASLRASASRKTSCSTQGVRLLNMQMGGMLVGGILWGVLGDKRGRLSVLFGSIIMYSLANLANGFVQTVDAVRVAALHRRHRPRRRARRRHHARQRDHAGALARLRHDDRRLGRHSRRRGRGARRRLDPTGEPRISSAAAWASRCSCCASASPSPACSKAIRQATVGARQLLALAHVARDARQVPARHPGRRADLVRHRHPDHVLAGVRPRARDDRRCPAPAGP